VSTHIHTTVHFFPDSEIDIKGCGENDHPFVTVDVRDEGSMVSLFFSDTVSFDRFLDKANEARAELVRRKMAASEPRMEETA
jgi:hypothetical protein